MLGNVSVLLYFRLIKMIDASISLHDDYGGLHMSAARVSAEEQYKQSLENTGLFSFSDMLFMV